MQRTMVTVMCHVQHESTFVLHPSETRVIYFPVDGSSPHVVYLCPGCSGLHRDGVDLAILDRLCDGGATSDWPVVPDNLAALDGLADIA
jgi:hypothetical protein